MNLPEYILIKQKIFFLILLEIVTFSRSEISDNRGSHVGGLWCFRTNPIQAMEHTFHFTLYRLAMSIMQNCTAIISPVSLSQFIPLIKISLFRPISVLLVVLEIYIQSLFLCSFLNIVSSVGDHSAVSFMIFSHVCS